MRLGKPGNLPDIIVCLIVAGIEWHLCILVILPCVFPQVCVYLDHKIRKLGERGGRENFSERDIFYPHTELQTPTRGLCKD